MTFTTRTPTKQSSRELSTKEEQISQKKKFKKKSHFKSESLGNLLIRNIQRFKSSNTEKIWLWLDSRLQRKESWLKDYRPRFFFFPPFFSFCGPCHHLANCQCGYPAEPSAQNCLTSFSLAKLHLCPGKLPNRGLNKREIRFNSCHFGGLQSSQGSCRALKAVVTLREAGSKGCRMCVCVCMWKRKRGSANRHLMCLWGYGVSSKSTC